MATPEVRLQEKPYDPTMKGLVAQTDQDWGDPLTNRDSLVPYGIKPIDIALYGIDMSGEFVLLQGPEKGRKTTVWLNVVANIFTWKGHKPTINVDTLETGMRPKKVRDALISIMASRYLISQGHAVHKACPACDTDVCKELTFSPKFLRYNSRTREQLKAIEYAKDITSGWDLLIHGPGVLEGNTRSLDESQKRWVELIDKYGMSMLVVDHVQQYNVGTNDSDYEKQLRAVAALGSFSAQHNMPIIAVSQVSMGSLKDSQVTGGKLVAAGGAKAAQEANTVFSISYGQNSGVIKIKIEEAREAGSFSTYQRIDDVSGTFIGEASTTPIG